ncbi:ZapG family protein [Vreelandella aquamarina]|uniref:ZapG family protein n=1 Tax=Vreelandella aquamarina TaxID=77097 RepID=UPI00384CA15E
MEASSPFTFTLIGLAIGFAIGLGCYRLFSKSARDIATLKQALLEREHQIAELKKSMGSHLTSFQQRLDNIRFETSQLEQLVESEAAQWKLPSIKPSSSPITGNDENDSGVAMPRDYAAGKNGTLSEDFGLKESHQPTDSAAAQPPRY